jgi:macrolide transport system ATP-binding/permease protein
MRHIIRRLRYTLRRRRFESDLEEELAFHREMKEKDLAAHGFAPDEARFAARRALGNDALARDQARDVWIPPVLQDLSQDVRFAVRLLLKDRRFTAAVVLALALPIGINSSWFGVINAALIRDLPFDRPDQLVSVRTIARGHITRGGVFPRPSCGANRSCRRAAL